MNPMAEQSHFFKMLQFHGAADHKTAKNFSLVELAKECPDLIVSIKLGELVEANTLLIQEARKQLEQQIADANTETYPSVDKVCEILGVTRSTLWRWDTKGYLKPLNVGGKKRYRMSDIKRIIEKGSEKGGEL